jgi:hypothetical protein
MLVKKLTDESGTVETAIGHSADAPAERTPVEPEEDKRGGTVRQG